MPDEDARWGAVQRLVDGALDLRPAERRAWLAQACDTDAALYEDAVALLRSCERAEGTDAFLAASAIAFAAAFLARPPAAADDARVQRERALATAIERASDGRYVLEAVIGRGGMGTVFGALDRRHERRVAVKVLDRSVAPAAAGRFLREVRTTAALTHPHIVAVHDSGSADGCLYFVMPYVDGETLQDRLRRTGALPLPEAVRLLRDVTDALAYAHAHDFVHRDLKPANVLLAGGHALVADFGVAKALRMTDRDAADAVSRSRSLAVDQTSGGVVPGTPAYMAPEQVAGLPVDARTDLYALGLVMYEALSGVHPFRRRGARRDVRSRHAAPPALAKIRADVPPALATLVSRLLAERPAARPRDAAAVLRVLDELRLPAPHQARRPRVPVTLAAAALIALSAAIGYTAWQARAGGNGTVGAVASLAGTRGTADQQAYDHYLRGRYLFLERGAANLESAIRHFRAAIARDPAFARAHAGLAMAYAVLPLYVTGADSVLAMAEPAAARAVMLDSTLADARVALATVHDVQLRFSEADRQYRAAIELQPDDATLHHWYGFFLFGTGRTDEAARELARAVELDPLAKSAGSAAALAFIAQRRYPLARSELQRVLAIDSTFHLALLGLAIMHVFGGMPDSAVVTLERAAQISSAPAPGLEPMLLLAYAAAGRWQDAERMRAAMAAGDGSGSVRLKPAFADLVFGDREPLVRLLMTEEGRRKWYFEYGFGCHPVNAPLWTDARFTALMRQLGVTPCPHVQPWPLAHPSSR